MRLNVARDRLVKLPREAKTWYTLKIVIKGNTINVFVDGKSVMTYTDPNPRGPKNGGISLGGHWIAAEYRNIRVTDDSAKVLFKDK